MTDSTRRSLYSILIALYLAVQWILPLRGFAGDGLTTRGDFSWNMYSKPYDCEVAYIASLREGAPLEVDYRRFFQQPERAPLVLHSDVLPRFHEYLCRTLRQDDDVTRIDGICLCSMHHESTFPLIEADVDICSAPNHGVIR